VDAGTDSERQVRIHIQIEVRRAQPLECPTVVRGYLKDADMLDRNTAVLLLTYVFEDEVWISGLRERRQSWEEPRRVYPTVVRLD
jgi:hypothetical protein